jgi:hypothetical protein
MFSAEACKPFQFSANDCAERLAIRYSAAIQRHAHSPFVLSRSPISGDRIALRAIASDINIGECCEP